MSDNHRRASGGPDPGTWLSELATIFDLSAEYWLRGASARVEELIRDADWRGGLAGAGLLPRDLASGAPPVVEAIDHEAERRELTSIPGGRFVPPTESGQLDRETRKRLTSDEHPAARCSLLYHAAGYELAPFGDIPADHVGHQLRFLAAVSRREGTALKEGRSEAAEKVRSWREGFARDHAGWWSEFGRKVSQRAHAPQIRIMAALLEGLQRAVEGDT